MLWMLRWLVAFVAMFVVNGAMAALIIGPLLEGRYEEIVASSPMVVALVAGYGLIAISLVAIHHLTRAGSDWARTTVVGVLAGAGIFLGPHVVQAGYTNIDSFGWVVSGLLDSAGPLAALLALTALSVTQGRRSG